jgi:hypothetical protein
MIVRLDPVMKGHVLMWCRIVGLDIFTRRHCEYFLNATSRSSISKHIPIFYDTLVLDNPARNGHDAL